MPRRTLYNCTSCVKFECQLEVWTWSAVFGTPAVGTRQSVSTSTAGGPGEDAMQDVATCLNHTRPKRSRNTQANKLVQTRHSKPHTYTLSLTHTRRSTLGKVGHATNCSPHRTYTCPTHTHTHTHTHTQVPTTHTHTHVHMTHIHVPTTH